MRAVNAGKRSETEENGESLGQRGEGGRGRGEGNIDSRKYRDCKLIESYKELNVETRVLRKRLIEMDGITRRGSSNFHLQQDREYFSPVLKLAPARFEKTKGNGMFALCFG